MGERGGRRRLREGRKLLGKEEELEGKFPFKSGGMTCFWLLGKVKEGVFKLHDGGRSG